MGGTDDGGSSSDDSPPAGGGDPVTGELRREHWIVPVHGVTPAHPDGIVQAIARRDGTVVLYLTCGDFQVKVWLDVCRAAQLSTGIWEAAGAAQWLTGHLEDEPASTRTATRRVGGPAARLVLTVPPTGTGPRSPPAVSAQAAPGG